MSSKDSASRAGRLVAQRLEALERAGVTHVPKARRRASVAPPTADAPARVSASESVNVPAAGHSPALASVAKPGAGNDRIAALAVIQQEVAGCTKCNELASTRTQTVFGVGNPTARLCFLGEAPGADEDRQGEPFVGRAGQLLTRIIEACGFRRQDVYILNVLKCRPPGNRNPLPNEVHNCRGFLNRQLEVIEPEFICCVGSVAAQTLLETDVSIGRLRGTLHQYRGIPVVCTYHPAYLLRNPAAKKDTWEDMKMLLRQMGLEPPGATSNQPAAGNSQ
jgi:uracil-DNA glycosylase